MSNKQNSTISTKPAIDPALQWIGGAVAEAPAEPTSKQADKLASQQVDNMTKQQANMKTRQHDKTMEEEVTAMLSARVPVRLIRKLRIRAATEGRPIQEIVADLLRDYLGED